jgi:hypothetical protein
MTIVTVCGLISSGKDTIADYLVREHGFRRESFAGSLKDAVAAVFNWDRTLLEGKTEEGRQWREQVDKWWAKRLDIPHLTPRWVLQQWGTEVCRMGFHQDIWVASLENRLLQRSGRVVVSDCRFHNEVAIMRKLGSKIIRVKRGPEPQWFDLGMAASTLNHPYQKQAQSQLVALNIHASEWSWLSTNFDAVIDNSSTFEQLFKQIRNQVLVEKVSIEA